MSGDMVIIDGLEAVFWCDSAKSSLLMKPTDRKSKTKMARHDRSSERDRSLKVDRHAWQTAKLLHPGARLPERCHCYIAVVMPRALPRAPMSRARPAPSRSTPSSTLLCLSEAAMPLRAEHRQEDVA